MSSNITPSTLHRLPSDGSVSYPLPDPNYVSQNDEPSCMPVNTGPEVHCRSSHPPSGFGGWETVEMTPGATYRDSRSDGNLLPPTHEFIHQDMGRPTRFCPLNQMENVQPECGTFGTPHEMEYQSTHEVSFMDGSPSMPSSSSSDCEVLTTWSGVAQVSGHEDHSPLEPLFNPLEHTPHSRSLDVSEDGQNTLGFGTTEVAPMALCGVGAAVVPPVRSPIPVSWRIIPQQRYTTRTRDESFLDFLGVIFSFDGIPGFNMKCALDQTFTGLDGRDEPVLEDAKGPVSCRLWFPGYPINAGRSQISVRNWKKKSAPITRSKLAYEIAKRVNQYLNASSVIPISPSADPRWTIGQGCMKIEKMYLIGFSWVSNGSLQPEIWVSVEDA